MNRKETSKEKQSNDPAEINFKCFFFVYFLFVFPTPLSFHVPIMVVIILWAFEKNSWQLSFLAKLGKSSIWEEKATYFDDVILMMIEKN